MEMWQRWPAAEIQHDLDVLVSLGLDSVRFFLRWQDFEPQAGQYEPRMFDRLAQFLAWCAERDLYAQPSLFVGWMSGASFGRTGKWTETCSPIRLWSSARRPLPGRQPRPSPP